MSERPAVSLWQQPGFARFWLGRSMSFLGSEMSLFVLPVTAATILRADATQIGLLAAAQTAPYALFGLLAGAWIDRWSRRAVMRIADIGRAMLIASAPLAVAAHALSIEMLYGTAFAIGSLGVFATIGYQAAVPTLAGRERLVAANAYLEAGGGVAEAAGPALGGLLIQLTSWVGAATIAGVSFLGGGLSLNGSRDLDDQVRATGRQRRSIRDDVAEGIRFVWRHDGLRAVVVCGCLDNVLGIGFFNPLYVLYATRHLQMTPATLGIVLAMTGAGAFVGAVAADAVTTRFGVRATLVGSQLGAGLARVAMTIVAPGSALLVVLLCAEFIVGASMPLFNVNLISLRQAAASVRLQGRVNATVGVLLWGATPVGGLLAGVVSELVGLRLALSTAAALTCLATAVLFVPSATAIGLHVIVGSSGRSDPREVLEVR